MSSPPIKLGYVVDDFYSTYLWIRSLSLCNLLRFLLAMIENESRLKANATQQVFRRLFVLVGTVALVTRHVDISTRRKGGFPPGRLRPKWGPLVPVMGLGAPIQGVETVSGP